MGWIATLIVAAFVAAAVTAVGVFSPNRIASNDSVAVTDILNADTLRMIRRLNSTATSSNDTALGAQLTV